jgi:putative colanic acid biosynthesis UDP-glucose lipid carrier transferase
MEVMHDQNSQSPAKVNNELDVGADFSRFYLLRNPAWRARLRLAVVGSFKTFVDPFLVVAVLYGLGVYFDISLHGPLIELAVVAFLTSALALDGLNLLLPERQAHAWH